jgi:5-methylcytosine-specific restriction endonuclease McrA
MRLPPDADLNNLDEYVEEMEERQAEYQRLKASLAAEWRERILARDGRSCRACGDAEGVALVLQLAHLTSAQAFNRFYGYPEGLQRSYREDNLITLCGYCHSAQHGRVKPRLPEALRRAQDRLDELAAHYAVQRFARLTRKVEAIAPAEHSRWAAEGVRLVRVPEVKEFMTLYQATWPAILEDRKADGARRLKVQALVKSLIEERRWKLVRHLALLERAAAAQKRRAGRAKK